MLVLGWSGVAAAQSVPPTCDPAFNSALNARAWMGGKRDMESAQSTIVQNKTDSLLYMSCFKGNIDEFADQNDALFSDGHQRDVPAGDDYGTLFRRDLGVFSLCFSPGCTCVPWLTGCFIHPDFINSWNPLIMVPQWPNDSFQPTFLSLYGPQPPPFLPPYTNQSMDNTFNNLIAAALSKYLSINFLQGGTCGSMAQIWHNAKCKDFNKTGWITLADHKSNDRRKIPPGACGDRGVWNTRFAQGNPAPVPNPSYRGTIYTTSCGSVRPVPTGVIVNVSSSAHEDAVCPAVDCWYDHSSGSCKN